MHEVSQQRVQLSTKMMIFGTLSLVRVEHFSDGEDFLAQLVARLDCLLDLLRAVDDRRVVAATEFHADFGE
jgi:hypothetical protein